MKKVISKLSSPKKSGKLSLNSGNDFKHSFRIIPANEIEKNRSKAYTYLV